MKILVTGATGFVGQHVVRWLVNHGYSVTATGTTTEKAKAFDWFEQVTFIPCDYFAENKNYYEFFGKPDILIHLGWRNAYQNTVEHQIKENLPAALRFLHYFVESGNTKIVGVGTSQEYGNKSGCLKETDVVCPLTPYGVAKNTVRCYLELAAKEKGLRWNWIRQFYMSGDGQNPRSLHGQLESAILRGDSRFPMSGGEQLRDYMPVEKAAENICKIALQSNVVGIINSCTGNPQMLRTVVEKYISAKKTKIIINYGHYPYRENEAMEQWGDTTLLTKALE